MIRLMKATSWKISNYTTAMDYLPDYDFINSPTLCIQSMVELEEAPGYYVLDMQSYWWQDPPTIVSQETIKYITEDPYQVPMCPADWPHPPYSETTDESI